MPLEIRPLHESDLPAYNRITNSAFTALMSSFYPNGTTEADTQHSYVQTLKRLQDPKYKLLVVVDTDLEPLPQDLEALPSNLSSWSKNGVVGDGEVEDIKRSTAGRIVGVSVWKFYLKDRTPEEVAAEAAEAAKEPLPPSANQEFMEGFFAKIGESKKKFLGGRKHCLLHILATDPAHHRRGVGAVALEWGLGEADRLGLESYLEASDMGRPLYARWGFEAKADMGFDAREFGAKERCGHTIMIRPAKEKKNGVV